MIEAGRKTQFKPGQSGNPDGKPKGYRGARATLTELLAIETDAEIEPGKFERITTEQQLHVAAIIEAKGGNMVAYNNIMRQLEDNDSTVTITFASEANSLGSGVFSEIVRSIHGDKSESND